MAQRHASLILGAAKGLSPPRIADRKAEHVIISTEQPVEPVAVTSWQDVFLRHNCLPEIDLADVDLSVDFLGHRLAAPVVISSMTGGHELARSINGVLAEVAERLGVAMGVGSQRAYLRDRSLGDTYSIVRDRAPSTFIIANVGAPQLIPQDGEQPLTTDQIREAIDLVRADALAIHLNYLQEVVQPEGDTRSRGVLKAIEQVAGSVNVPIIAKETGAGMALPEALRLRDAGVRALDVGGLGGTSFALVEAQRARLRQRPDKVKLGELFGGWGIPTAVSIALVRPAGLPVIATGGIRSGLDAARALAIGADVVGLARPMLLAAQSGVDVAEAWLRGFLEELRTAMFLTGSASVLALREGKACMIGRGREMLEALQRAS
ncbi:MAG: type 2 isopentenyl-diphosphate Delta-isomerase [Chloroflexota bacterium]